MIEREVGLSYTPKTGYQSYLGDRFNIPDFLLSGGIGSVGVEPYQSEQSTRKIKDLAGTTSFSDLFNDKLAGFNIHSHPEIPGQKLDASSTDREGAMKWGRNFVTDKTGLTKLYTDNVTGDEDVTIEASVNPLNPYPSLLRRVSKKLK